jgi:transcription elongation factor Elf1
VNLSDIRGKSDVCSANAPSTEPDEVVGYVEIVGLQPVVPGEKITFKIGGNCGDDSEYSVTVKVDGVTIYSADLDESCTFSVTIPSDADKIEIIVNGDEEIEEEGEPMNGSAFWYGLQSLGTYDPTPWPDISVERTAGLEVPSDVEICDIFRWKWSAFYDGREQELKDALDIDINQLGAWVGGDSARASRVIYLEFIVPGSLGGYSTETFDQIIDAALDPAIRLVNGKSLPNELTVATEWPLYVRGDYNSVFKRPASLAGDGITILSSDWDDDENRPHDTHFDQCKGTVSVGSPCYKYEDWANDWGYQNAEETTVNAAILAGHWPTPCDHAESGCPGGYDDFYGGGIENFPRFLERWRDSGGNKVIFHYAGALISPFTSQKTTGTWNGTYYVPPQRDWSFDTDFRDPQLLPPATPNVGNVLRTGMREAL